jgi:hypothetical protein
MSESEVSNPEPVMPDSSSKAAVGRLFVLDLSSGRIFSVNTDAQSKSSS